MAAVKTDSPRSWGLVFLIGLAVTVAYIDRVLLSVATPAIMTEFHLSGAVAGLLLSAFFWSYTLMPIPMGWLVDRYGSKWVLAGGYALWSVACASTGWTTSLIGLFASRLGLGVGESPVFVVGYRAVATVFSERHRGLASAIYSDGAKLGPAIGTPLAAWLIVQFGWRHMFFIVGVLSLLWLIPWLLTAPTPAEDVSTSRNAFTRSELRQLFKKREIWGMTIGYFGYLYVFYFYITWLPGYLALSRGVSTSQIGWLASLPFAFSPLAGLLGGWAADRFIHAGYSPTAVRKSAIAVGLVMAMLLVPAAVVPDARAAALLFMLSVFGGGIAAANMLTVPASIAPAGKAGVIGAIQQMAGNFGGIVAPIVTGALYDQTHDFTRAVIAAGAMLVVSGFGYIVLLPRIQPLSFEAHSEREDDQAVRQTIT